MQQIFGSMSHYQEYKSMASRKEYENQIPIQRTIT